MKALITGATSGIGYEIAKKLDEMGYDLILVGRNKKNFNFKKYQFITLDLSIDENNFRLYEMVKKENIDLLVCGAGFGSYGFFNELDIYKEINQINLNVKSLVILNHLFLQDMIKKNKGYILNIASLAGSSFGPLMNTYYATKNYVRSHTFGLYGEIKSLNKDIGISCLMPGPVKTNFFNELSIKASKNALLASEVASYAIDMTFRKKLVIIPSFKMKLVYFLSRLIPNKCLIKINLMINQKKEL